MKIRVWQAKLMLIHHMRHLDESSLANRMYKEQVKNIWPGLAKETEDLCNILCIENVNETDLPKKMFYKIIKKACNIFEDNALKCETQDMQKMRKIRVEKWGQKEYVKSGTLYSVRSTWKVRSYMLDVAGNFSHHRKYESTGWKCQGCSLQVREDQDHLTGCDGYSDLAEGKDFEEDADLVEFYRQVMARREEQGWN